MPALPSWLNPVDVIILFVLIGGVVWGFLRGLVRMALSLVVLYLATVIAMTFYVLLGERIQYLSGFRLSQQASETLAFVLVLILVAIVLNFALRKAFANTELPGVRQIDQLGGLVIGFLLVTTWIGLMLVVLTFVLRTPGAGSDTLRQNLLSYMHTSRLVPVFDRFLPVALATLKPWLPKGQLPEIFKLRLL